MNKNFYVLAQYYLPDGTIIKVVQDITINKFYRIETDSKNVKIKEIEKEDLNDCITAVEAYKNEVYNLSHYPQVKNLFKEESNHE